MESELKVLVASFSLTVVLALIIIPILRKLKVGQIERTDGPQSHLQKQGTPTMGGIIIAITIIIVGTILAITTKEIIPSLFSTSFSSVAVLNIAEK